MNKINTKLIFNHKLLAKNIRTLLYDAFLKKNYEDDNNEIYVGANAKDSHLFFVSRIEKKSKYIEEYGFVIIFNYYVDDVLIKQMLFRENDKGKIGKPFKTNSEPAKNKY
tara:strand:+ start:2622 stop:2951 length:330 start_codon:yes stop_codon:yes gene_type:complete